MQSTFSPASLLYGFAATGALATCFAIVLHPLPLSKPPNSGLHQDAAVMVAVSLPVIPAESEPKPKPLSEGADKVPESSASLPSFEETVIPQTSPNRTAQHQATIVGVWAPDASPCTVRNFRDGFLPTIINTDGAWAGDTFCMFRNQKKIETGWGVLADCSNSRDRWTAPVRMTVKGDRLIWASKRGVQVYTRCTRDFLMAEAP